MSAFTDDGVYILVSRGRRTQHGYKTEYRIIHARRIGKIWEFPDYPQSMETMNSEMVLRYFGEAWIFTDKRVAEGYAQDLYDQLRKDGNIVEHGITWLYSKSAFAPFPKDDPATRPPKHREVISVV